MPFDVIVPGRDPMPEPQAPVEEAPSGNPSEKEEE